MKKLNFLRISILTLILTAFAFSELRAQCDVPPFIFPSDYEEGDLSTPLYLSNTSSFQTFNSIEPDGAAPYYMPNCGVHTADLTFGVFKPAIVKVQMYLEVWKQKYDCNGNEIGSLTYVSSTPTVTYSGSQGSPISVYLNIGLEANTYYQVKARYRKRIAGWGNWIDFWSNNIRFIESLTPPNPDGVFVDELSVDSRSGYNGWTVDVHQLDQGGAIDFDASATTCENNWKYTIAEFDLNSWTSSNTISSWLINGQAGNIDLDGFYSLGLEQNKLYMLTVIAGAGWYPKNYWFELKDVSIDGSISNNGFVQETIHEVGGGSTNYQLYERCRYNPLELYTAGTESETGYKISLVEVDGMYTELLPTAQSTGWIPSSVASSYYLNSLFSIDENQRYKLTYEVEDPLLSKVFYFRVKSCFVDANDGRKRLKAVEESNDELLQIYPNPTTGNLFIEIGNEEDAASVEVMDLRGKVVLSQQAILNGKINIDLNNHENGIYLIRIIRSNNLIIKKIIKH